MNVLSKNRINNKLQVKILQGLLNVHNYAYLVCDGVFGEKTRQEVLNFQRRKGLTADGIVGDKTWAALGVLKAYDNKIMSIAIDISRASAIDVLLKDGKGYSTDKFAKEGFYDIVINGAFFDMKSRINIADMVIDGKLINGGNYSDKGLCFDSLHKTVYCSKTADCIGDIHKSFIGGTPFLMENGIKAVDMKGLTTSFYNSAAKRTAIGEGNGKFYIMLSLQKIGLNTLISEAVKQNIKTLVNLDGGGSQSLTMALQNIIPTDGRLIPSAIGVKL